MNTPTNTAAVSKRAKTEHKYKRICIPKPASKSAPAKGKKRFTTVSLYPQEFAKALKFAYGDERRVTDAVRHVAAEIKAEDVLPGDLSLVVRRKALARLRGQYRPAVAAELAAKESAAEAALSAANNQAWAMA
jgi:hypothetical protein